ncbi:hypothetical protein DPEC_G00008240 [Dallia pectoralis]|uniref:Uncharacterized protein n=1 Tax=Dallia pectoralis TaxID=75939 RepID=A0ACC2HKL9_DALPE|nr:hypothetical protein DPEC_G00008240 [Dallia pectoralis]
MVHLNQTPGLAQKNKTIASTCTDQVSAEALWEALTEQSAKQLKNQEEKTVSLKVVAVGNDDQRERGYLQHLAGVRFMFHLAQLKQAYSTQRLSFTHPDRPT